MLKYSYDASGNLVSQAPETILPPQITGQPVRQVVEPGEVATFSVVVSDASGMTFRWKFNGTDIPGATGDSLLLTNASTANEGQYSVMVTNSAGNVTSAPAALMLDTDRDELPDTWEKANFTDPDPTHPLNPASQRSETDPDKDGVSNLDEFLDGTDPNSNTSLLPRLVAYSDAGGSVTVSPMKLSYNLGEPVTLTPTEFAPSVFIGWTGDLSGTSNPGHLTMDGNKTVRARFAFAVPIPPGVVAFWRGETDANNHAKDLIGGHDGTFFTAAGLETTPSVTASGKVGRAFTFDGTVHVRVPASAAMRPGQISLQPAQITVEAWVFPTARDFLGEKTIITQGLSDGSYTWHLGMGSGGEPRFTSHQSQVTLTGSAIPLNVWTHLAISFDGATKRLYVNGAEVGRQGGLGPLVYDAAAPLTIGLGLGLLPSGPFNGRVDEVAIYNRALTANEVFSLYNADFLGRNVTQPYFTSPSQLVNAPIFHAYSQRLTTILGTPPIRYSMSAGGLARGLTLSPDGLVHGIAVPSVPRLFDFTVRAMDAAGNFTEQLCVLRVV